MEEKSFNLDHFYTSFPEDYFNSLKQLTEICKNIKHIQTNNGYNSYEGVYIRTKDGHYVELLNRSPTPRNNNRNFIAINTLSSPLKDVSTIQALVGEDINLKRTEQPAKVPNNGSYQIEDVGKDWFYVWYIDNKIAIEENTSIWIIDYQDKKFNKSLNPGWLKMDFDFKQVLDVKWSLNSKQFEIMKTEGRWFTNDYKVSGDFLLFSFNNPNGKDVKFEFTKNDNKKPGFVSITLEKIDQKSEFNLLDSPFIELLDEKDKVIINFNEY